MLSNEKAYEKQKKNDKQMKSRYKEDTMQMKSYRYNFFGLSPQNIHAEGAPKER